MTDTHITRPPSCMSVLKTLTPLRIAMEPTHNGNQFYYCIKSIRRRLGDLDLGKFRREQDPLAWDAFVDNSVKCHPKLRKYHNFWPIEVYFDYRVQRYLSRNKKSSGRSTNAAINDDDDYLTDYDKENRSAVSTSTLRPRLISTISTSSSRSIGMRKYGQPSVVTRVFIGERPPPLGRSSGSRGFSELYIPSFKQGTSESISTCNKRREEANDRSSFARRFFPVKVSASTLQCTRTTIEELYIKESGNTMTYPAMCFQCGRIPYVPPSATEALVKLFNNIDYLIPILAVGGLLHDLHLKMFLKWSKIHRLTFLEELCAGLEVSPLDKMLLTKIFIDDIENLKPDEEDADDDRLNPFQITIARPSEEAERRITDLHNPLTLLRQAMKMSSGDEDTYEDIINIIDTMSKDYLSSLGEDLEHDRTELILLIKAIRFKRPSLSRYQEDWPIKFYLSRRAKQLGLPSPPTDKDAISHNDIKMSNSDSTNTIPEVTAPSFPHQIRPVCDVHVPLDLSDISPKMQIYLRNYGMEELTCTLVTAGVQSDDQFERFCEFSQVERRALLQDEKVIRINAFQRMMIDIGF